jgi:hypothetical protein
MTLLNAGRLTPAAPAHHAPSGRPRDPIVYSPTLPPMQLMLSDLPATDTARVHAFVRLGSDRLGQRWSVGSEANVQLVLYGGDMPATIPGTLDAAPYLVRVVDPDGPPPSGGHTMVRPIGFDALIDAMAAAEAALLARVAARRAARRVVDTSTPAPPPASEDAASAAAPSSDTPVRLRRWPPNALLTQWRYGVRMASFLSARYVSVRELAVLSNVAEPVCGQFVAELAAHDLLRVADAPVEAAAPATDPAAGSSHAAPPGGPAPTSTAVAPAVSARRGLLGRLRDKLGIGLARGAA